MLSENDLERERYEAQVKFERDRVSFLEEAYQEGYKKGFEQGIQGLAEETKEDPERRLKVWLAPRIQFCERMLNLPQTSMDVLMLLPLDELKDKEAALDHQLLPPKA